LSRAIFDAIGGTGRFDDKSSQPIESESGVAQVMDEAEVKRRIEVLRIAHRDLDAATQALLAGGLPDPMQVARLKKRKLRLKDEITQLEDMLIPDILA
jgi:hypothetical protein